MNGIAETSAASVPQAEGAAVNDFLPRNDTGDFGRRPALRSDLVMRAEPGGDGGGAIIAPMTDGVDRSFVFGPNEFRLASCLNGKRNLEQVRLALIEIDRRLVHLRLDQVNRLVDWIDEMGLLAKETAKPAPVAHPLFRLPLPCQSDDPQAAPETEKAGKPRPNQRKAETGSSDRAGSSWGKKVLEVVGKAACLAVLVWCAQTGAAWLRAGQSEAADILAESDGSVELAAAFDGILREVWVRDGDKVYPGDLLVRIDNLKIQNKLEELRKELIECQKRRDEFYEDGDTFEYRRAIERLATITHRIGQLRCEMEEIELRSPIAGVIRVSDELVEQIGQTVHVGQQLLVVEPDRDSARNGMLISSRSSASAR